ncbi:hypothetical protein EV177_004459 [Coemansia sp. RSA 1804]|nr:hypothetical protein EV177_004459 [Coemansia sp. RSA 1804]
MLVGVHNINLAQISSGVNNIKYMPLVANTKCENNMVGPYDLGWYFGYSVDEIRLLIERAKEANGGRLGSRSHSEDSVLDIMTRWYNGYRVGTITGKYNSFASVAFLEELSSCQSLEEAAQPFWGYTGNSRIISAITLKNKDIVGRLAFHLIREYKDNTLPASHIVATRHRQHNPDVAISESVQHVTLCANSLPDRPDFSSCTLNELVTLFLYTGYLTLRDSATLKIPDGELLDAWEDIQLTAIFNSENTVTWDNERDALLQSLCDGDMRDIYSQFNSVLQQLSNASRNAHEAASADLFRAFILAKLGTTSHSRAVPDGARGSRQMEPISIVEGEGGDGRFDWRIVIPGELVRREGAVSVTVEFKHINKRQSRNPGYPVQQAHKALDQIITTGYADNISGSHRRVDIGVAIGDRKVAIRQRVWERATPAEIAEAQERECDIEGYRRIARQSGLSVETLDQQLADFDNAGWVDSHGWMTMAVGEEFRVL